MEIINQLTGKVQVIPVFEGKLSDDQAKSLEAKGLFKGEMNTYYNLLNEEGEGKVFLGLGKEDDLKGHQIIKSFYQLVKGLEKINLTEFDIVLPESLKDESKVSLVLEGLYQSRYKWDDYKSDKKDAKEFKIALAGVDKLDEISNEVKNLTEGVFKARDLVNIPAIDLYPESYANKVVDLFKGTDVEVEVLNLEEIKALGMESFLAVAEGSDREARFMVMKYLPLGGGDHLTLVGKGLTYDSGGYALKPAGSMDTMKSDMAGSAAVVGTLLALSKNKVQKNVVGVVAACENLISGHAYKNGDIISSMKGTSIEVGNTDAEGRLTLADAIYYSATKLNSKAIVDIATLTGACIVALGEKVTGLASNNDELADLMLESSVKADEPTHRLPIFDVHREQIKGKFGDLLNSTTGGAGMITAAAFLEHFTEDMPWVHLDIAGPSFTKSAYGYLPAGGTGTAVKTLYHFAKSF